jgi:hypothetical protein
MKPNKTKRTVDERRIIESFNNYGAEVADILIVKNKGYGSSVANLGHTGIHRRINEKMIRIQAMIKQKVPDLNGESIRDNILDIAGYAILELMLYDRAPPFEEGFVELNALSVYDSAELIEELNRRGITHDNSK